MNTEKIKEVLSENLGEGYRIVKDNNELSPEIEWVEWVNQSEEEYDEDNFIVEVHYVDDTTETFDKGILLKQIWKEDC